MFSMQFILKAILTRRNLQKWCEKNTCVGRRDILISCIRQEIAKYNYYLGCDSKQEMKCHECVPG